MEKNKALLRILKKIPIFKGLSPSAVQKVLGLCEAKTFKEKETICAQGSDSDEMFILISGELGVMGDGQVGLAILHPITTVGEMGMFNRHKRSASVEAIKQSKVLVIERAPFEYLLRSEAEIRMRIYQNIVEILSSKIVNDNTRARDYLLNRLQAEKELQASRNMLDIAVRALAEKGGISTQQVREQLEEQVGE
jgi:CRP/FNR family transcriptional regulator, cyclic AMP receptor protein